MDRKFATKNAKNTKFVFVISVLFVVNVLLF
jgi:hypothetical protein